jgi:hypothetical protein
MQRRPTVRDILYQRPFDLNIIALDAGTSAYIVREMTFCHPVSGEQADAVLKALSKKHGTVYTLETVDVPILHDNKEAR